MKTHQLITILLFATQTLFSQTEKPQWVNVSPFKDSYYRFFIDGFFISANEGWIFKGISSKEGSILYHTNDGATSFDTLFFFHDTTTHFLWLQMTNSKNGYATASGWDSVYPYNDINLFLKTIDGGKSWENIYDTSFFIDYEFTGMKFYFIDSLTGFTNKYIKDEGLAIYKTIDGTKTWQKTNLTGIEQAGLIPVELSSVIKFFFVDSLHGWATCYYANDGGICLATTDGGLTWSPVGHESTPLFGLHFITPLKGGMVGRSVSFSHVYITENNFKTFSYENQNWAYEMQQYACGITYQNDSIIWITGTPGTFYKSINNGQTFEEYQSYLENGVDLIYTIQFFDGNIGYAIGADNKLMKYTDTLTTGLTFEKGIPGFNVFPNPTHEKVTIKFGKPTTGKLSILTLTGIKKKDYNINNQKELYLGTLGLTPGLYFVVLTDVQNNQYTKTISIQ